MTKLPPVGSPERQFFLERMLTDTGFLCRNVLGMDTDRDERGNAVSEIGAGGVRTYGPHQQVIEMLDDDGIKHCVIMAPRFSYKSSMLTGFIVRKILAHPNIAMLLVFHDADMATERCRTIRNILTDNAIIKELFGDLRGAVWTDSAFTVSTRSDGTLTTPTFCVATPRKAKTGGRFNIVVFDDIVSETNFRTEIGLRKSIECMESSLSLASKGCRYIDVGTPYHQADAHHWAIDQGWKLLKIDAGCEVTVDEKNKVVLSGDTTWPNLPIDHLRTYLKGGMGYQWFMSQFMLQVVAGVTSAFKREQLQPEAWREEMRDLTGYLLTDIAPSGGPKGDLNVLMYVGIDEKEHVHILDLEIGPMLMAEFCDRFLRMVQRWATKVTHRLELMELTAIYYSYEQFLRMEARKRNQRLCIETQRRTNGDLAKTMRIAALQSRFQAGTIHVCSTVPRTWNTGTTTRDLWNPEGLFDEKTRLRLPSGDLVEQFTRFPNHLRDDIPDTLALVDAVDKNKQRICAWVRPAHRRQTEQTIRRTIPRRTYGLDPNAGAATRFYNRIRKF